MRHLLSDPAFLGRASKRRRWRTDFREYPVNQAPAGWALRVTPSGNETVGVEVRSGGLISANRLRVAFDTGSAARVMFVIPESLETAMDAEMLMLAERGGSNTQEELIQAALRHSWTSSSSNKGLGIGHRNNLTGVTIRFVDNGVLPTGVHHSEIHGASNFGAGGLIWMRGRLIGQQFSAKAWDVDTNEDDLGLSDEPGTWALDVSRNWYNTAGQLGLWSRSVSGRTQAQNEWFVHFLSFGFEGEAAPRPKFD